jgi:hypothetical protein
MKQRKDEMYDETIKIPIRGHGLGKVRTCPACEHERPVGTTSRVCPACSATNLLPHAEDLSHTQIFTGSEEHAALLRHNHNLGRDAACDGDCGLPDCRRPYFDASGLTRYRGEPTS